MQGHPRWNRRAFTLLELLIVIVIIALLLSLSLPGLTRARQTVQRIMCSSNLRSLELATFMYMDGEGRGLLPGVDDPYARAGNFDSAVVRQPFDAIAPYLDARPLAPSEVGANRPVAPFSCPADALWSQKVGFSYVFWPSLLMVGDDLFTGRVDSTKVQPVTLAYERGDQYYDNLWADLDSGTHQAIAPPGLSGWNAIHFNGQIAWIRSPRKP